MLYYYGPEYEFGVEMKVMQVSKVIPEFAQSFCNILWVDLPKSWLFNCVYQKGTMFISIIIESQEDGTVSKIRRNYVLSDLEKQQDNIWELAHDCVGEIIRTYENG